LREKLKIQDKYLYLTWRKNQYNTMLKEASGFGENIIKEMQTKNLNEATIANIKEMVCTT